MTNEEAARILDPETTREALDEIEYYTGFRGEETVLEAVNDACRIAADALRKLQPDCNPLTLEQLWGMEGKPVWVERNEEPHDGKWFIVDYAGTDNPDKTLYTKEGVTYSDYGKHFAAYLYPPAHIDREAWEKPCDMCGGKTTLYQHTNTTKLFMNTFGEASTLVTECMACPPYADCCMKGISVNSAFKIKFCPECGRPLTDEAWAELEKRLRGCME